MSRPLVRTFRHEDADDLVALKQRATAGTGALVHPAGFYQYHPGFAEGANIMCAEEAGRLVGFAAAFVYPLPEESDRPRRVWVDVRADPEQPDAAAVKDALLEALLTRLREVAREHTERAISPYAGGFTGETESLDYYRSRGFVEGWRLFEMRRDLALPLVEAPLPAGLTVQQSRLETEAEREVYLRAHGQAFPDFPKDMPALRSFLASPMGPQAVFFLAWSGDELVGSVLTHWQEAENHARAETSGVVDDVFVLPAWRRRGLATHMVTEALRYLRDQGLGAAGIEVRAENAGALAVYRAVGYRPESEVMVLNYGQTVQAEG